MATYQGPLTPDHPAAMCGGLAQSKGSDVPGESLCSEIISTEDGTQSAGC